MPNPIKGETKEEFIARFMSDPEAKKSFPDQKQRLAVAYSKWRRKELSEELKAISKELKQIKESLDNENIQGNN